MKAVNQIKDPNQGYFKVIKNEDSGMNVPYKEYNKMYDNQDNVKLIFQNGEYKIVRGNNDLWRQNIARIKGESDEDYRERAIKEFDKYCDAQQNFKKQITPEVIKSRRIDW